MIRALTLALCVASAAADGAVTLTKDNYATEVAGKNAFVKFLAPW